jgi:hypothetical protein
LELGTSHQESAVTAHHQALRARLDRVVGLVQLDRGGAAAALLSEMTALVREGRTAGMPRLAASAEAAAEVALVWQADLVDAAEARVIIFRFALAMIRELGSRSPS